VCKYVCVNIDIYTHACVSTYVCKWRHLLALNEDRPTAPRAPALNVGVYLEIEIDIGIHRYRYIGR